MRTVVAMVFLFTWGLLDAAERSVSARERLRSIGADLPFLCLNAVLKDRPMRPLGDARDSEVELHGRKLAELARLEAPTQELVGLLADPDPRIRTLAAVALFQREDPRVLPALAGLAEDTAPTYDAIEESPRNVRPGAPRERRASTVGAVSQAMVEFYLTEAGYHYGLGGPRAPGETGTRGTPSRRDFEEYWTKRKNRGFCASWCAVSLLRAQQMRTPVDPARFERIREVRRRVDRLPVTDRAWTLLWLRSYLEDEILVGDEELTEICRTLGSDALIQLLQFRPPTDDPDLQPRPMNDFRYAAMCLFVLDHARHLLRSTDAETLLECERWQLGYRERHDRSPLLTSRWAIAAAELRPDDAITILRAAYDRSPESYPNAERLRLTVALWRLGGMEQIPFILDRFYRFDARSELGTIYHSQATFFGAVDAQTDRDPKPLVAALIRDARFRELGWQSLDRLATLVNSWCPSPVIDPGQIAAAQHPDGISHFDGWRSEESVRHPVETRRLEETLNDWRTRLRDSLPRWSEEKD